MRQRVFAIIVGFLSCAGSFDTSEKLEVRQGAKTLARNGPAPPVGDFRHQIAFAVRAITPALVSITATLPSQPESSVSVVSPSAEGQAAPPVESKREGRAEERAIGSGVIVDAKGYILTTHHVIAGIDRVRVVLFDEQGLEATLAAADPEIDLAVLRVDPGSLKLHAAALGDSDRLQLGEWVVACGKPSGLRQTVSAGIVSGLNRPGQAVPDRAGSIQTDARIQAGSSGGPLVNLMGRVIGINSAPAVEGSTFSGVGFAIPINKTKQLLEQLLRRARPIRDAGGLFVDDLSDELAASFGYQGSGGALVHDVAPDGPGARAGIIPGDIVIALDGRPVANAAALREAIVERRRDDVVKLTIWRENGQVATELRPAEARVAIDAPAAAPQDVTNSASWGLELADIGDDLRARASFSSLEGALVNRVEPRSSAEKAGVQLEDVIISVNGKQVREAAGARELLEQAESPMRLQIARNGHARFVILTRPNAKSTL